MEELLRIIWIISDATTYILEDAEGHFPTEDWRSAGNAAVLMPIFTTSVHPLLHAYPSRYEMMSHYGFNLKLDVDQWCRFF